LALQPGRAQLREAGIHKLEGTAANPVVRIPLGPDPAGVDLAATVAISFKVKGERGDEFLTLALQQDSESLRMVALGNIFQFLPTGITTEWKQVVLDISPQVRAGLPRPTSLRMQFLNGGDGIVYLKDLLIVPRAADSQGWDTLAISLQYYDIPRIDDISVLVLNRYEGEGAQVGKIVEKRPGPPAPTQVTPSSRIPEFQDGYYNVADFDRGWLDSGPPSFATFQRSPSEARMDLDAESKRGGAGRSLRLEYERQSEGFCGLWLRLGKKSEQPPARVYLDAAPFRYLSFWIKGQRGGESLTVQLADEPWEAKGDSVPLAALSDLLENGVTTDWQEVIIPLDSARYPALDFNRLASLTFNFHQPGSGVVYVDDIAFKTSEQVHVPATTRVPTPERKKGLRRATWLWETATVLQGKKERRELFRFAHEQGINVFFLQIRCRYGKVAQEEICQLADEEELRSFIRDARRQGIEVHALDGYSYHVLPRWHPKVLAQVRAVLDFNARVRPAERFAGIHHDNEPYLIPAFSGKLQELLLVYYLDLTVACQQLIEQAPLPLVFGVDIPFWYDGRGVTWRGVRKPVSHHVIDIVDHVGVMAYRTDADGANGVIALASDEMDYAGRRGKEVFVALETGVLPDQVTYTFANGAPVPEPKPAPATENTYLVLEEWNGLAVLYWKEFEARATGASLSSLPLPVSPARRRVFLSRETTWVPAEMLSFADFPAQDLEAVLKRVQDEFRDEAAFAGVAIHHYDSYRKLTRERKSRVPPAPIGESLR
jgi:hypothetical protein